MKNVSLQILLLEASKHYKNVNLRNFFRGIGAKFSRELLHFFVSNFRNGLIKICWFRIGKKVSSFRKQFVHKMLFLRQAIKAFACHLLSYPGPVLLEGPAGVLDGGLGPWHCPLLPVGLVGVCHGLRLLFIKFSNISANETSRIFYFPDFFWWILAPKCRSIVNTQYNLMDWRKNSFKKASPAIFSLKCSQYCKMQLFWNSHRKISSFGSQISSSALTGLSVCLMWIWSIGDMQVYKFNRCLQVQLILGMKVQY